MKKVKIDEKWKRITFFSIVSEKYGKMSKKVKNDENGSDIDKKGQNWWKMKKNNLSWIFSEQYGKMSQKVKNDENGSDINERGQIDEKWKK